MGENQQRTCDECDWSDRSPDGKGLVCTRETQWKEVDPTDPACGEFVRTEEVNLKLCQPGSMDGETFRKLYLNIPRIEKPV